VPGREEVAWREREVRELRERGKRRPTRGRAFFFVTEERPRRAGRLAKSRVALYAGPRAQARGTKHHRLIPRGNIYTLGEPLLQGLQSG